MKILQNIAFVAFFLTLPPHPSSSFHSSEFAAISKLRKKKHLIVFRCVPHFDIHIWPVLDQESRIQWEYNMRCPEDRENAISQDSTPGMDICENSILDF